MPNITSKRIVRVTPKLKLNQLESMAESLRVYDVVQDGWEGDPEGSNPKTVEQNLTHVGYHLADVIERKSFSDYNTVRDEIAPDAMQYALRVARWGKIALSSILSVPGVNSVSETAYRLERPPYVRYSPTGHAYKVGKNISFASFVRANGVLARQLHDEDHNSTREQALTKRADSLRDVSKLLIQSAIAQSDYDHSKIFDLEEAFDRRLHQLRTRFDIPEPQEV